jgi:hypothetical protein
MFTAPRWVRQVAVAIAAVAIITPLFFRHDYWWMVSDDYQILEVQMRHYTESGVFAMWGEHDWRKYHWLSHGWGGLLNQLGGNPEVFTTLTRVMPFVYCATFAAALILLTSTVVQKNKFSMSLLVPAWTVVAVNRTDWSAPSTGGSLSMSSVAVTVGLLVLAARVDRFRRFFLVSIILFVAMLTKFPSVFGILLFFLTIEVFVFCQSRRTGSLATSTALWTLLGASIMVPGLYLASITAGGFKIAPVNPMLGSLGNHGAPLAFLLLLFSEFWFVMPLVVLMVLKPKSGQKFPNSTLSSFLMMLAPFAVFGLLLEIVIAPINSNGHEYFSAPFFLIASVSFLAWLQPPRESPGFHIAKYRNLLTTSYLVLLGLMWNQLFDVKRLSIFLGHRLLDQSDRAPLISFILSDSRTGVAFAIVVFLGFRRFSKSIKPRSVLLPLFLAWTLLTFSNYLPKFLNSFKVETTLSKPSMLYGSMDLQAVGSWLKSSTKETDIVATNYLRNQDGDLISDYGLAVWSERTFFVLGPGFFVESQSQILATKVSEQFAETSSSESAKELWTSGVRWFVVDTALVTRNNWNEYADEIHRAGRFVILRLRDPT